ncbi:60S ribosomal protein [Mycena kentingensis (nom. inval.)]|nr:60S ribosomal protein [Mycena kentingensis (nom. inval.)]
MYSHLVPVINECSLAPVVCRTSHRDSFAWGGGRNTSQQRLAEKVGASTKGRLELELFAPPIGRIIHIAPRTLLRNFGIPPLTPEIAQWADFKIPFSDPHFQHGCIMDVDILWPYTLAPPYAPSDFEISGQTQPFRKVCELEAMVHGALLREEREKEARMKEDWDADSSAEAYADLCRRRLELFAQLRQLIDNEDEDAGVDDISVYTRAMVQLHCRWVARSFLRLRSLAFLKSKAAPLFLSAYRYLRLFAPRQERQISLGYECARRRPLFSLQERWLANSLHAGSFSYSGGLAYRALYKGQKGSAPAAPVDTPATVEKGVTKNCGKRLVSACKALRLYSADDVRLPQKSCQSPKPTALRSSITPGTVLILLAGRFRGKRVVFFKQLASGLLLVTGPFKINGVPLRRLNQAYVIATYTKIDLEGFTVDEKLNDAYFAKSATKGAGSAEAEFFEGGKPKAKEAFPESKAADQKAVDKAIIASAKKTENLVKYLGTSFGLSKGQFPHELVF